METQEAVKKLVPIRVKQHSAYVDDRNYCPALGGMHRLMAQGSRLIVCRWCGKTWGVDPACVIQTH